MKRERRVGVKASMKIRVRVNRDAAIKPLLTETLIVQVTPHSNKGNSITATQIRPVMWPTVIVCIQAWMALLQIPLISYGVS